MFLNKKWISVLCCLSLLLSFAFSGVNVHASEGDGDVIRYSVLILDTSGSMDGTPAEKQEEAALKFCESVLKTKGTSNVALVELNTYASVLTDFTNDFEVLKEEIENLYSWGGTNINDALRVSNDLLSEIDESPNIIKNVVLCTDGLPESGQTSYDGPYTYDDYEYANTAYATAQDMKNLCNLYSLGFFHSLYDEELVFARRFMSDLQNAGYYEVTDPSELQFTFGDIADDIVNDDAKTFYYDNGYSATCYYKDDYFKKTSYEYNPSLATMSLSFAMSAFANGKESDYKNKSSNARMLLKSIVGVSDDQIEVNDWFTKKPTSDSIGVVIGNKKIQVEDDKFTLIAIAVRGGGYEQEWASNFTIGRTGQHDGFNTAKNNVISFLKSYVNEKNISGSVKFWITGYSRAAATANLVGGEIDSGIKISSKISYEPKDVYTYCFKPPAGALTENVKSKAIYNNIYSIINLSDPVPYVAPAALGFSRYGIDRFLPSRATTSDDYEGKMAKMLAIYQSLENTGDYVVDDFQMKKLALKNWLPGGEKISFVQNDEKNNFSQGVFLSNYVTIISKDFLKNRDNYVNTYQDEIRELCKVYFGSSGEQADKFKDSVVSQAKNNSSEFAKAYINPFVSEKDALKIVSKWLKNAINDAGITDYDDQTVENAGVYLGDLFLALISNHPNYFTTMVYNIERIGAAHYPELCFSWLASMDENYSENATESFSGGSYRIIRINCDVDVDVMDESGTKVASIINEIPQNLGTDSLISGINENGEKYVIIPVDADYQVKITGRSDDTVNYGISEYSADAGDFTRVVNYFEIDLREGESLEGNIPSYSQEEINSGTTEGSQVDYILKNADDQIIPNYVDLAGKDATNAYYSVDISSSDDKAGVVLGGGTYQYGSYAQVMASENEGYTFKGWYDGAKLVSSDKEFRLCVKSDMKLIAKFGKASLKTNIASAKISLKKFSYVYDGKKKQPAVTVKIGGTTLKKGIHYKISYKNNKNIGTASVTITGTGGYTGSATKTFKIIPKGTSLSKVSAKKKGFAVKWKKQAKSINGYQIQYSTNRKFTDKKTKIKTVAKNKTTKLIVSKLKGKKKYYVHIRTYKIVKGKKYYSSWSKVKVVITKK